jgi:heme-degrading monooxygenase HmoA
VARIWRGRTPRSRADAYQAYHHEAGIAPLLAKALGVQIFREDRTDETEFVTISFWENLDELHAFTGGDPSVVHHLERDPEFLLELPREVQVLRLLGTHGVVAATR